MKKPSFSSITLTDYMNQLGAKSNQVEFTSDLSQKMIIHSTWGSAVTEGPICLYVLDYRTREYCYVGQNTRQVIGIPPEPFLDGGVPFCHQQMHEDDLKIFLGITFQKRLTHLVTVKEERDKYWYTINYRLKDFQGKNVHVLQQTKMLEVDEQGYPLVVMGYITNITNIKHDNRIVDTISKWDEKKGLCCLNKDIYFPGNDDIRLSERETEILKWVLEGLSSKCIADKLYLSTHTVNTHRKNMLVKTNAKNTADLLRYAFERGII